MSNKNTKFVPNVIPKKYQMAIGCMGLLPQKRIKTIAFNEEDYVVSSRVEGLFSITKIVGDFALLYQIGIEGEDAWVIAPIEELTAATPEEVAQYDLSTDTTTAKELVGKTNDGDDVYLDDDGETLILEDGTEVDEEEVNFSNGKTKRSISVARINSVRTNTLIQKKTPDVSCMYNFCRGSVRKSKTRGK